MNDRYARGDEPEFVSPRPGVCNDERAEESEQGYSVTGRPYRDTWRTLDSDKVQ